MIKKSFIIALFLLAASVIGFRLVWQKPPGLQKLNQGRDLAIQKAVESGDYRCCISPPCTMCFWEGNQWNNNQAGTCACDDLVALGKKPCPQCQQGFCETDQKGACQVNGD